MRREALHPHTRKHRFRAVLKLMALNKRKTRKKMARREGML